MSKKHIIPCIFGLLVLSGCSTPLIEKAPEKEETTEDNTPWGEIDESAVSWGEVEEPTSEVTPLDERLPEDGLNPLEPNKEALPYKVMEVDNKTLKEITESDGAFEISIIKAPSKGECGTTYIKVKNVSGKDTGGIVKVTFFDAEGKTMETHSEYIEALGKNNTVVVEIMNDYVGYEKLEIVSVASQMYGTPAKIDLQTSVHAGVIYSLMTNVNNKPIFVGNGQIICYKDGEFIGVKKVPIFGSHYLEPRQSAECDFTSLPLVDEYEVYFQPIMVETTNNYFKDYKKH